MKKLLQIILFAVIFSFTAKADLIISSAPKAKLPSETRLSADNIKFQDVSSQKKVNSNSTPRKAISSVLDILGLYEWNYYNAFNNAQYGGWQETNIQIVATEEENIVDIYGYNSIKISATVDIENKTLTIAKQFAFDASDGMVFLTPFRWNSDGQGYTEVESIEGSITDRGIFFDEYDLLGLPASSGGFYGPLFAYGNSFEKLPSFTFKDEDWVGNDSIMFKDGWLNGSQYHSPYKVCLKRNKTNPNRLCIINPYGADTPNADVNELRTPGYIVIDADDQNCVIVEEMVFSGFKYSYEESGFYMHNSEASYLAAGQTKDKIKSDFKLAKKEISHVTDSATIIIPTCLFGMTSDPTASYYWENSITHEKNPMIAEIYLPDNFQFVINPKSISLNQSNLNLLKGESSQIEASIEPQNVSDSSVTWTSTNSAVATVENGLVTAVGGGECDIVASTHNGFEAKCHVTVSANPESISFEASEVSVLIGDKVTLTPILSPEDVTEKALTWASSDTNVATVEDGVVTCIGLGETSITATTVNNLTAECKVIVNPILAETITLDQTEVEVPIGETFTLTATISPDNTTDNTVTWASSDPEVATVEDGVVTCVGVGEAIITATTTNGLTATCTVKVQMILVESIQIDPSEVVVEHGEQVQLTAIVLPENATNKNIEWTSDNEFVARVDENGLVTIISKNVTTIHAKATDGSGVEGTCEVTGIAGVESLLIDGKQWNVFTPDGVLIRQNVTIEDIRQLAPAIYIISDGTRTLKLVR